MDTTSSHNYLIYAEIWWKNFDVFCFKQWQYDFETRNILSQYLIDDFTCDGRRIQKTHRTMITEVCDILHLFCKTTGPDKSISKYIRHIVITTRNHHYQIERAHDNAGWRSSEEASAAATDKVGWSSSMEACVPQGTRRIGRYNAVCECATVDKAIMLEWMQLTKYSSKTFLKCRTRFLRLICGQSCRYTKKMRRTDI